MDTYNTNKLIGSIGDLTQSIEKLTDAISQTNLVAPNTIKINDLSLDTTIKEFEGREWIPRDSRLSKALFCLRIKKPDIRIQTLRDLLLQMDKLGFTPKEIYGLAELLKRIILSIL